MKKPESRFKLKETNLEMKSKNLDKLITSNSTGWDRIT